MKVLTVDDDSSLREVLQLCLERFGYRVRSASCAVEALAVLEEFVPEVVICDLHLGGVNGIEVCVAISDLLPTAKIFLMTGDEPPVTSSPKFTVIRKPISIKALTGMIGPSQPPVIESVVDLAKHVEHISGSTKKFVLVLKSGPPRFTFMDWYELGFVTTWTRHAEEAEQILKKQLHDLLAIDLGRNVAEVSNICARFEKF